MPLLWLIPWEKKMFRDETGFDLTLKAWLSVEEYNVVVNTMPPTNEVQDWVKCTNF